MPGIDGGSTVSAFQNDFQLLGYSLAGSQNKALSIGPTEIAYQPLTATLALDNPGADTLLAEAASGTALSSVTLYQTNSLGTIEYRLVLIGSHVIEVQQADDEVQLAFANYGTLQITDYTLSGDTMSTPGATQTFVPTTTGLAGDATPPAPDLTLMLEAPVYLKVAGLTGPSESAGFQGDFEAASFRFGIAGTSGPLTVDLGANAASEPGVLGLYEDNQSAKILPTVTLYAMPTHSSSEQVVLSKAYVAQYSDSGGHVSLAFGYTSATETVTQYDSTGAVIVARTTATIDTPSSSGSATASVPSAPTGTLVLAVPVGSGGSAPMEGVAASGYGFGGALVTLSAAGTPAASGDLPLTVTLSGYGTVANILLADAANGTVLPKVTLVQTEPHEPGKYSITLTNAIAHLVDNTDSGTTLSFDYGTIGVQDVACFLIGTRIATTRGEIAVEDLKVGDHAITASGGARLIVWIGSRVVDASSHPKPSDVRPVRVACDAFGPGQPHHDLFLSPEHAIFVEGVMIPVRCLVNGGSVRQLPAFGAITYFHVELDRHDVLLAEGLAVESYLDAGNRGAFSGGGAFVAQDTDGAIRIWELLGCAPLIVTGPALDAARRRIAGAAKAARFSAAA